MTFFATVPDGKTLVLRDGDHGNATFEGDHASAVIIRAAPGATPRLGRLEIRRGSGWHLRGLTISPTYSAAPYTGNIVSLGESGMATDLVLEDSVVFDAAGAIRSDHDDAAPGTTSEASLRAVSGRWLLDAASESRVSVNGVPVGGARVVIAGDVITIAGSQLLVEEATPANLALRRFDMLTLDHAMPARSARFPLIGCFVVRSWFIRLIPAGEPIPGRNEPPAATSEHPNIGSLTVSPQASQIGRQSAPAVIQLLVQSPFANWRCTPITVGCSYLAP